MSDATKNVPTTFEEWSARFRHPGMTLDEETELERCREAWDAATVAAGPEAAALRLELDGEKKANALLNSGLEAVSASRDEFKQEARTLRTEREQLVVVNGELCAEVNRLKAEIANDSWTAEMQAALDAIPREFVGNDLWANGVVRMSQALTDVRAENERLKAILAQAKTALELSNAVLQLLGDSEPVQPALAEESALAAERQHADELRKVTADLLANPHGCPFCDSGKLRKRVDGGPPFHADDCPFHCAANLLASRAKQ